MKNVLITIKHFISELSQRNIGAYAGSISFFFLLSMIPILILISIALPLIGFSDKEFISILISFVPQVVNARVVAIVKEVFRLADSILPVTIITFLWSCARGMLGLMYGLNSVYKVKDDRGYFHLRLLATFYMILLILLFLIMLVLMVFGQKIQALLLNFVPMFGNIFGQVLQFRYLIVFVAGITILSLIYKLVPYENQPLIEQVPGACFTVVSWIIFSKIFEFFSSITSYSLYYGSLAVLILFMIWLYWCIYIILIGGFLNWYFRYIYRIGIYHLKKKHRKS